MGAKVTLSRKQRKGISALIECSTVQEAADRVGVSRKTVHKWLRDPDFRAALASKEDRILSRIEARLAGELLAAVDTLSEIHQDKSASSSARTKAAVAIIDRFLRIKEKHDLLERIERLEVIYDQHKYATDKPGR